MTEEDEMFQERAAIMEYDGGLTRPAAEAAARSILAKSAEVCVQQTQTCVDSTQICGKSTQKPERTAGPGYAAFKAAISQRRRG
jgi:hypothetical protein